MRKINKIVIHCSDSSFGCTLLVDQWHRERGWQGIGYHFVILNGYSSSSLDQSFHSFLDGMVEPGRPLDADPWLQAEEVGAHVYGYNRESIGICLIGKPGKFTHRQLGHSLRAMILELLHKFSLSPDHIYGHNELDPKKICPGLNMDAFRLYIENDGEAFLREAVKL